MSRPLSTGLIVPVPAAADLVAPWASGLPAAGRSLPPHVTALWPFLPVEACTRPPSAASRSCSRACRRSRSRSRAWPSWPTPPCCCRAAAPFRALTQLIWDEWPECPPFGGAYHDVALHAAGRHNTHGDRT